MLSRTVKQDTFTMGNRSHNPILVRAARLDDAARIAALSHQLLVYEQSLNQAMGDLTPWAASSEEIRKQMRRPNTRFFVAEKDGEVAGYLKVWIIGRTAEFADSGTMTWLLERIETAARRLFNFIFRRPRPNVEATGGYIAGVFVRDHLRRSGIGKSLVIAAEDWLRARGIQTCDLQVLITNQLALEFWEDLGYRPLVIGMRKEIDRINRI